EERKMGVILVSHDLSVVADRADDIAVMYAGKIVERGPARTVLTSPRMPYTEALLRAAPQLEEPSHTRLQVIPGRPPDLVPPPPGTSGDGVNAPTAVVAAAGGPSGCR